jgi:flagellar basal body-associated protein FliL
MQNLKKFLIVILVLNVVFVLALIGYYFYSKPTYEGEQKLKNIRQGTTVYLDDFSKPSIYNNSQKFTMRALGSIYAHKRFL